MRKWRITGAVSQVAALHVATELPRDLTSWWGRASGEGELVGRDGWGQLGSSY